MEGRIIKALSGFYYVDTGTAVLACRARGKFRHQGVSPLVGDLAAVTPTQDGEGMVDAISPRRNAFSRPAVANIDQLVIVASGAIPVTDPFLIDRMMRSLRLSTARLPSALTRQTWIEQKNFIKYTARRALRSSTSARRMARAWRRFGGLFLEKFLLLPGIPA